MNRRNYIAFLIFPSILFFSTTPVVAQQPTPSDDRVNELARQMYCPVCENTPLDVCPTKACAQWRELIRQKMNEGWSDQQIKDYFAKQYGDRVLAEPPGLLTNSLLFMLPTAILLGAVFILYRLQIVERRNGQSPEDGMADQQAKETNPDRVEDELTRFKKE